MAQSKGEYRCNACGASFGSRGDLDNHNNKFHPAADVERGRSPESPEGVA